MTPNEIDRHVMRLLVAKVRAKGTARIGHLADVAARLRRVLYVKNK